MKKNKVYVLIEEWHKMVNDVPTMCYYNIGNICYNTIDEAIADAKSVIRQCVEKGEDDFNVISETDYDAVYIQKNFNTPSAYNVFQPIKRKLIVRELKSI